MSTRTKLFLAAASSPGSREHLRDTVLEGVSFDRIQRLLRSPISEKMDKDTRIGVWGLVQGQNNDRYWKKLVENDVILFNVGQEYTVYSKTLHKEINTALAKELWKPSERTSSHYDRIILLKDVRQVNVPISKINQLFGYRSDFKPSHNISFLGVKEDKVETIVARHGSIESAIGISEKPSSEPIYLLARTVPNPKWPDKEGEEHHFGTNVANYLKMVPGADVVFDKPIEGRIHFLGYARITKVEDVGTDQTDEGKPFARKIAYLQDYVKFDPPNQITSEQLSLLQKLDTYNTRNSILTITKQLFDSITRSDHGQVRRPSWSEMITESPTLIERILDLGGLQLEIERSVVERIITHLSLGKNVILLGPPGTGKTDLARRILRVASERLGLEPPIEAVASYEWGRYEVIGGKTISPDHSNAFHLGCVVRAIVNKRLLLIDEFNRADMNRAFGEMFLALDHKEIPLREDEKPMWLGPEEQKDGLIRIPEWFRMICTLNDYDKSLLSELSYGLLRRFAFVEIGNPDIESEKRVALQRAQMRLRDSGRTDAEIGTETMRVIDVYFDFMKEVRESRKIGVATSIDILTYLLSKTDGNAMLKYLGEALTDYLLPQLDRLDISTLTAVRAAVDKHFPNATELNVFRRAVDDMLSRLRGLESMFAVK